MKTLLFLLVLALAGPRLALAQNTQLTFAQAAVVGATTSQTANPLYGIQAVADAQGNTYFTGYFGGTVRFGAFTLTTANGYDVFVAKRDAAGTYLWATQGGGPGSKQVRGLALDAAGDVVVTGYFDTRTASFGSFTLNNASPATASIKKDVFVAKLSGSTRTWLWAVSAGGGTRIDGEDSGTAVTVDVFGNIYVAGTFDSSVAFFGTIQVASTYPGRNNVFLAKLTAAGQWVWVKGQDYLGVEVGGLSTDPYGNIYLTGAFARNRATFGSYTLTAVPAAAFVAKIDGAGTWQWATSLQPQRYTQWATTNEVRSDGGTGVYLAGSYLGDTLRVGTTTLLNNSATNAQRVRMGNGYVARLHADTGVLQWVVQTGGLGGEGFGAPQLSGAGHVLVAGSFNDVDRGMGTTFGTTTLHSAGGDDLVVAQLDTTGRWLWVRQAGGTTSEGGKLYGLNPQGRGLIYGVFFDPVTQLGPFTLLAYHGQPSGPGQAWTYFTAALGANGPLAVRNSPVAGSFAVYPNPARTAVTVAGLPPGRSVELLDVLGRTVLNGTVPPQGELRLALPVGLPAGLYLVRAGTQARRLVVE